MSTFMDLIRILWSMVTPMAVIFGAFAYIGHKFQGIVAISTENEETQEGAE